MPLDGLTLSFVAHELRSTLLDGRIEKVTQPEKDMLVLLIRANGKNHRLLLSAAPAFARVHLTDAVYQNPMDAPMFCMLMRKHLSSGRMTAIEQLGGDRILRFTVENKDELGDMGKRELYVELMGRHSNITLVMNGRIVDAIRHVSLDMSRVRQALPGLPFVLPPEQDKLNPADIAADDGMQLLERMQSLKGSVTKALQGAIRGLSPMTAGEIAFRITGMHQAPMEDMQLPLFCQNVAAFFRRLPELIQPCLQTDAEGLNKDVLAFPYLSLDPARQIPCPSLSQAMDRFYFGKDRQDRMQQKSVSLKHLIKSCLEKDEKKLALQEEELSASARMEEYRIAGELLTAQGYLVPRGVDSVSLPNFYDPEGREMKIDLDVALTPAQNAQKYFKRYRKARSAQQIASEQKEKTLQEINLLEQALFDLNACQTEDDLKDVRRTLEAAGIIKPQHTKGKAKKEPNRESKPLRFISPDGTEIFVGKNSVQNDRLTGAARGSDTWLHAKDMPSSHVIIRSETPSDETLMMAAKLAAFYSKARGVQVPVDYTLRKYVKKPGGSPPGFVIYTHQHTLIVNATEGEINAMHQA